VPGRAGTSPIPTIAGGVGFATAGGSYGGALFYFQPYKHDRFRILAALGGASLDLDFFGFDPDGPLSDQPIAYTIKSVFTGERLQARLGDTHLFIGAHYSYLQTRRPSQRLHRRFPNSTWTSMSQGSVSDSNSTRATTC
jgi:hypothetical protein